jgi:hypothetical protein
MSLTGRLHALARRLPSERESRVMARIWGLRKVLCEGRCPGRLASGQPPCGGRCGGFHQLPPERVHEVFGAIDESWFGGDATDDEDTPD